MVILTYSAVFHVTVDHHLREQESCAIAKMIARCALYK